MLATILVPLDGSELAERAVPYAADLARAAGARVAPFHVYCGTGTGRVGTGVTEQRATLERAAARLRAAGVAADPYLAQTPRPEGVTAAIVEAIRAHHADLVVMSTHGHTGTGRCFFSRIAEQVVAASGAPVLLITPRCAPEWPTGKRRRFLVALDGSAAAEAALPAAENLVDAVRGELVLLRLIEPLSAFDGTEGRQDPQAEIAVARSYLDTIAARERAAGRPVEMCTRIAPALSAIAAIAVEEAADAVVLSSHGLKAAPGLATGATVLGTLQRTNVPLLLVHPAAGMPVPAADGSLTFTFTRDELAAVRHALSDVLTTTERDAGLVATAARLLDRLAASSAEPPASAAIETARAAAGPSA